DADADSVERGHGIPRISLRSLHRTPAAGTSKIRKIPAISMANPKQSVALPNPVTICTCAMLTRRGQCVSYWAVSGRGGRRGAGRSRPIDKAGAMPRTTSVLRRCVPAIVLVMACLAARAETTGAVGPIAPPDFRAEFKDSLTAMPDPSDLSTKGTIYIPTYSRVYGAASGAKKLIQLSTTLRIDNTSSTKPLVIERIEYYETSGNRGQIYVPEPLALRPFGTIEIVIPAEDESGGIAANFIVEWAAPGPMAEPLVEAVMIGTQGDTSYSFVSPGRPIRHVGRSGWPQLRFRV